MQTPVKVRSKPVTPQVKGDAFEGKSLSHLGLNSPIKLVSSVSKEGVSSKDKVIVCVKARPVSSSDCLEAYELDPELHTLGLSDTHSRVIKRGRKSGRAGEYTYSFDALHLPPAQTISLYEQNVAPLVLKCMAGFNSTIFAYGQTGSGKTHTMTGTKDDIGVIPLAISSVFQAIEENPNRHYLLRVSYLEIYNESIRDILMQPKKVLADNEKPNIHVENGVVQVRPLIEEIVKSPEEILELLKRGMNNRKTGATDWNERSSRSHCVFTLTIESREGGDVRRSRLTLIDLAGSEKAVSDAERLVEGKYINRSLLALGTVIEQLSDTNRKPGSHIPYRNSKLTHLLENALGGNANIAVICTLSLEERHQAETLETLKFASRCAQVQTKAVQGIVASSEKAMLIAKEEEIAGLRLQLEEMARQRPMDLSGIDEVDSRAELATELQEMQARRMRLMTQITQLNGQILSSSAGLIPSASGHGIAKRMRRRVSDNIGPWSPGRLTTLMTPPNKNSRRAVSGSMAKLLEDHDDSSGHQPSFTTEDVVKVARYHRRNQSNQINDLASDMSVADLSMTGLELKIQNLIEEKADSERKYEREKAHRMELEDELEAERKSAMERDHLARVMAEDIVILRQEIMSARQETEMANARVSRLNELGLPRPPDEVTILTHDKQTLRHTGSLKEQRLASMDPVGNDPMLQPLPYSVSARLQKTREAEEVDRLEKVIVGLKTVQDELLGKVEEWQKRVLDQNDKLQQLTESILSEAHSAKSNEVPVSPTSSPKPSVLTPSKSSRSNMDLVSREITPSTPRAKDRTAGTKSFMMSPGSPGTWYSQGGSPRPIPMHEGMKSNASARKGRRLTVEHDLERLQSSSRVDEARSLFTREAR